MQTLIIKSIHEHGFGFAFTKDEHDQVFLPKKLLADFEHLDWLEPADEVYAKIIPTIEIRTTIILFLIKMGFIPKIKINTQFYRV